MRKVDYFKYWLPPSRGAKKPYLSRYLMSPEEAEKRGAIRPEPHTKVVMEIPETPQEMASRQTQSAGRDSVKPPPREK